MAEVNVDITRGTEIQTEITQGAAIQVEITGGVTIEAEIIGSGPAGPAGPAGADGSPGQKGDSGEGVPVGGTTGQVLKKKSNADYDTEWANESGGGGGTSDYADLTNKPSIEGVTLSGNKTASDLGLAKASDIPPVPVQSVNGKTGPVELDASDVGALPDDTAIPTKTSDLINDSGFITGYTESDPTVPSWAKAASKPSYTASEVGAIPTPASPATGAFLVWNGSAWTAQTLSAWQGGNY